jgi:hypothetical protein
MELVILVLVALFIPAVLYGRALPHPYRNVWGLIPGGKRLVGRGAYREMMRTTWVEGRAPIVVRISAYMSFLLGQMIVPGALAALVGLVMVPSIVLHGREPELGILFLWLSAPTGLIVAWRLLDVGKLLLRRDPLVVETTRKAAAWEIWHNAALIVFVSLAAFFLGGRANDTVILLVIGPAIGAIAHGVLLLRAATALERYSAFQQEARALQPEAPQELLAEAY